MSDALLHSIEVNPKNWEFYTKNRSLECSQLIDGLVKEICDNHQASISRKFVMDACKESPTNGLISTFIWGYPNGRFPGGKSFLPVFESLTSIAEVLRFLKENPGLPTLQMSEMFRGFKNIGPSTYTKILYFFEIRAQEGKCLIYDQMVMRSIAESTDSLWSSVQAELGPCRSQGGRFKVFSPATQEKTYGKYIEIANSIATASKTVDAIELELFLNAPRGRGIN